MGPSKQVLSSVYSQIRSKILMSGPISVADYMRIALTSQMGVRSEKDAASQGGGYYMEKDVFGRRGDFITSPEISQMFGEMLAIWGITAWRQIGGPKKISIVELGPGRGTLARDILRVFHQLKLVKPGDLSLHLVEISPFLATTQANNLCGTTASPSPSKILQVPSIPFTKKDEGINPQKPHSPDGKTYYHHGVTKEEKFTVYWYRDLASVPRDFHLYIAHEFFDALPVHKLQKVNQEWREVLIDLDTASENEKIEKLRYIVSRHETPTVKIIRNHSLLESLLEGSRAHLEISLDAASLYEELVERLDRDGGISLIVDYGHEGTKEDTFRAFRRHAHHDPLLNPGTADLTADVDFSQIIKLVGEKALVCGPINQKDLLECCGINARLEILQKSCKTEKDKIQLLSGYNMLMNDMGERFKCLALFPKILEDYRPKLKIVAFDDVQSNKKI